MEERIMSNPISTLAITALVTATLVCPALAQQGGNRAGQGGPPPTSAGSMQQDRDRLQDQDRLRDQDRDRLYLGTQDRLRQHDRDRDGRISREEFQQWHEEAFNSVDTDGGGSFTLPEFLASRLGPGPRGDYNASRNRRAEERAQLRKTERFRLMDGDGDGKVTRNEYMKFGELNYLDADLDDDGRLTFREMQEFHRGW
jgi:hypothetical protein